MGYMRNHSIAVGSWDMESLNGAHSVAVEMFGSLVTPVIGTVINGEGSFFIAPDGSKQGWPESNIYDEKRRVFVAEIAKRDNIRYCEFMWADDGGLSAILRQN